jgi:hypothetical protein
MGDDRLDNPAKTATKPINKRRLKGQLEKMTVAETVKAAVGLGDAHAAPAAPARMLFLL